MVVLKLEKEEDFIPWLRQHSDKPVLVKFFTTWCAPCQVLQKNLNELEKEQSDLVILEVDADRFPTLEYQDHAQKIQQLAVYSVPTLFLFQAGKKIKEGRGALSIEKLREFIKGV